MRTGIWVVSISFKWAIFIYIKRRIFILSNLILEFLSGYFPFYTLASICFLSYSLKLLLNPIIQIFSQSCFFEKAGRITCLLYCFMWKSLLSESLILNPLGWWHRKWKQGKSNLPKNLFFMINNRPELTLEKKAIVYQRRSWRLITLS